VDVRLDNVVLRSLEKEPERRYQHASEVKTDVEAIGVADMPDMAASPGPAPSSCFSKPFLGFSLWDDDAS